MDKVNLAGIILAAGEGKRAGGNKALLKVGEQSFLEIVTVALKGCGCSPIIAVLGAQANEVKKGFRDRDVKLAVNENWELGQFSSLKRGLEELPKETEGAMVTLVDHPMVTKDTYNLLCMAFTHNPGKIIIPVYEGRRGHPVTIPRELISKAMEASENDNLKNIIEQNREMIFEQMVNDPGVLRDIDTDKDLKTVI